MKYKKSHRTIAVFFFLIFFPTLLPTNLYASNNGPVAPEAASFEPVDASDMVNLSSGDLSYGLPLLNVPSPEGGYPISLSYHAGIALDQEATWVGLGWSLNPGSLNRFANGTPDDWTKSETSEFFYDNGAQNDYYNFSIGGMLPNGITVGLGASWGSNQSVGGSVMIGYENMVVGYSTNGGLGVGAGGFYMDSNGLNTSGVNLIGVGARVGDTSGSNMSASAGLDFQGKVNFEIGGEIKTSKSGDLKKSSVGASFSSVKLSSSSFGSQRGSSTTSNNYEVNVASNKFGLNLGFYWFGFGHTRVTYSLFDVKTYKSSGALYPEDYKINEDGKFVYQMETIPGFSMNGDLDESYRSDTYVENMANYNLHMSLGYYYEESDNSPQALLRANYDNYEVNSQGLSGRIVPYTVQERFITKSGYKVSPYFNETNDLGDKTNFHLQQSNASFLRVNNGKFNFGQTPTIGNMQSLTQSLTAGNYSSLYREGNVYSTTITPGGNQIKSGDRIRSGNYVEFFTNAQIILGVVGFIEAKGVNRAQDQVYNTELKGIGAYRVTTSDGKTYHYSLPVYQYETFFKNFKNVNNEDENYFESKTERKYATHWLLTAITGADYVDTNNNGQVDNADYGYWVEFQYGKWSDGYCWRTPSEGFRQMKGSQGDITSSSYSWGRKQIYYLDMIKTRTHSAVFVKKLREDDNSNEFNSYATHLSGPANFNKDVHCVKHVTQRNTIDINNKNDVTYYADGNQFVTTYKKLKGKKTNYKYLEIPRNSTLALDRILLLKNEDVAGVIKNNGELTSNTDGYLYYGFGYTEIKGWDGTSLFPINVGNLYSDVSPIKRFSGQLHQNVIDVSDIEGSGIEQKAVNGVKFNYNYELAHHTFSSLNSQKGRLTLKSVDLRGKEFKSILPAYRFDYHNIESNYDADPDVWGYHKTNPKVWSLKTITTPTGSKVTVDYESDSFRREAISDPNAPYTTNINMNQPFYAAYKSNIYQNQSGNTISNLLKSGNKISMNINVPANAYVREFIYKGAQTYVYYNTGTRIIKDVYEIESFRQIEGNRFEVVLKENEETKSHDFFVDQFYPSTIENSFNGSQLFDIWFWIPTDSWTITGSNSSGIPSYFANGKPGGGLRVSTISLSEGDGSSESKVRYSYLNPNSNKISGITSYEPSDNVRGFPLMSVMPAPQVMYEYVTVTRENVLNQVLAKTVYQFNVIRPVRQVSNNLISENNSNSRKSLSFGKCLSVEQLISGVASYNSSNGSYQVDENYVVVKDRTDVLRAPKTVRQYNQFGHLLSEKEFFYDEDLDEDGQQGVIENTDVSIKRLGNGYFVNRTSTINYPSSISSLSTTEGGYRKSEYYDKYDFLTGEVLQTTYKMSDGKYVRRVSIPAYNKYAGMGSKYDNPANSNMLSQNALEYSYVSESGLWKMTGVGITTWKNDWSYTDDTGDSTTPTVSKEKIWRKHKMFTWNGTKDNNGIFQNYNVTNDDSFNWSGVGIQPSQWKQLSEITLYDHYSMPLESRGISGNKVSTKMGDKSTKQVAVGDAGYNELYYTGGEYIAMDYWLEPEIRLENGTRDFNKRHTGKYSLATTSNTQFGVFMRNGQHKPGRYKLNVWVHKDNAAKARLRVFNNGTTVSFNTNEEIAAGDWILKTAYLTVPAGDYYPYLNSADGTVVYYDDLMIRPVAAGIAGFVYDEYDRITYMINNNGLATKYIYNDAGQLIETHIEVFNDQLNGIVGGFKLKEKNKIKYKSL